MNSHKAPTKDVSYLEYLGSEGGKMKIDRQSIPVIIQGEDGLKVEKRPITRIQETQTDGNYKEMAVLFMVVFRYSKYGILMLPCRRKSQ